MPHSRFVRRAARHEPSNTCTQPRPIPIKVSGPKLNWVYHGQQHDSVYMVSWVLLFTWLWEGRGSFLVGLRHPGRGVSAAHHGRCVA